MVRPDTQATGPLAAPHPEQATAERSPLKKLTIRASLWTLGSEGASNAIRLVSNLILTRLLFPEAFGIMAVVQVFIQGLSMFSDVGIRPLIIQHARGDDPAFLNTIWTVRLLRGATLGVAACLISWPVARFYGEPLFVQLLPVAGLTLVLEGLQSTKFFSRERHLALGRPIVLTLASSVLGVLVMIGLALAYRSIWALIVGGLATSAIKAILSHSALPGPGNRLHWDREARRELFHFGKWVFVSSLATFVAMQADKLIFAKMIPIGLLGVYAIGANFARLPTETVLKFAMSVALPAFSRAGKTHGAFLRLRLGLLVGGGAGLAFLILCGPYVIQLLYDPRYWDAGWILQIIAIGAWFQILEGSNGVALLALGQTKWLAVENVAKIAAMLLFVPPAFVTWGFPGALVALSLVEILRYLIGTVALHRSGLKGWTIDLAMSSAILTSGLAALALHREAFVLGDPGIKIGVALGCFVLIWLPMVLWALRARTYAAGPSDRNNRV
ncbi:MAG: oligosaccharide flippase family protein [Planctomycetes bacterium]|nr:oligosaccharide flippase family protein [Planctomycetota bacterium]